MEAFPLLTVIDYNLIYVCVKQAWLYNVISCIKPCDFNRCIVIFVTLINIKKIIKKKKFSAIEIDGVISFNMLFHLRVLKGHLDSFNRHKRD